jgi:hypothetical protein
MMESTDEMARPANVSGGAIMAAIVAALPIMFVGYGFGVLLYPFAVVVTSLHAALLGVPLYYLLRRWFDVGWTGSAIAGLVVGVTPLLLLSVSRELEPLVFWFCAGSGLLGGLAFRWGLG